MRSNWPQLLLGGLLGSAVGVVGATISDPEVGFPAWVDLTGVVVGFALGVLAVALLATAAPYAARLNRKRRG
jgi:hypothetical protein